MDVSEYRVSIVDSMSVELERIQLEFEKKAHVEEQQCSEDLSEMRAMRDPEEDRNYLKLRNRGKKGRRW